MWEIGFRTRLILNSRLVAHAGQVKQARSYQPDKGREGLWISGCVRRILRGLQPPGDHQGTESSRGEDLMHHGSSGTRPNTTGTDVPIFLGLQNAGNSRCLQVDLTFYQTRSLLFELHERRLIAIPH